MDRSKDRRFFESLVEDTEVQHDDGLQTGAVDEYGLTQEQDSNRLRQGRASESRINGRYTLRNELGSGGFATVYRAWDENLQRDVAVKIMRPELLQAEHRESFLKRFEREALLVARLDHNHLAPVYETGLLTHKGQDTAFIVMKYLEGYDLSDVLQNEKLPIERTLDIITQTLEALAFIHSEGVVHKDLKPSNIFLCQDHLGRDHAYLMDFGIAHDTQDAQGRLTNTGVLTGTFQYMPPEYVLLHQATPSVDVFQMGLIITEALTGVALIHRNTTLPALVARYLRRDPFDLPTELAESPAGAVISRALMLDVEDRYTDAKELLAAFSALTPQDFPAIDSALIDSAERNSEEFLSDPGLASKTKATHAEIPSAIDDDTVRAEGTTDVSDISEAELLAELAGAAATRDVPDAPPKPHHAPAPTKLSQPDPRHNDNKLYIVGVLVALSILGATGAIFMLNSGSPPPTTPVASTEEPGTPTPNTTTPPPTGASATTPIIKEPGGPAAELDPVEPPKVEREPTPKVETPPANPAETKAVDTAASKKATPKKPVRKKPVRKKPVRKKPEPKEPDAPVKKKPTITLPPEL